MSSLVKIKLLVNALENVDLETVTHCGFKLVLLEVIY